jgi:Transcriptional regulators
MKLNELNIPVEEKLNSDIPIEALFSIICRNQFVFVNRESKKLNITGRQIPCLRLISDHPGITQDDIANTLQIDKGFIARVVKKLEDDDFLYRTIDPTNRRKYHIYLTEKGKNIIPEIKAIDEKWEKIVFEGLKKDEKCKLMDFIELLAKNSIEKIKNCD